MKTTTFLIGNGFIKHLQKVVCNEIESHPSERSNLEFYQNHVLHGLEQVDSLFGEFDNLERELASILGLEDKSLELVYHLTDDVISWYRTKSKYHKAEFNLKQCLDSISLVGQQLVNEKIIPIVEKFEDQEIECLYRSISQWTENKIGEEIDIHLKRTGNNLGVFTTNYDGFVEQFLRTSNSKNQGFLFKDGFAGDSSHPLTLYKPHFNYNRFIGHLHSSYKYGWNGNQWVKFRTSRSSRNVDPLIVYMKPSQKKRFIDNNPVLRAYWIHFEKWLNNTEELVIYGNSLNSDPHIKDVIKESLSKDASVYIADINAQKVYDENLTYIDKNRVFKIDTGKIELSNYSEFICEPSKFAKQLG
jgi:hypothetical protein